MNDIEILAFLDKNCGNDETLSTFTKRIFMKEFEGKSHWKSDYEKIIKECYNKR